MRTPLFSVEALRSFFYEHIIGTMKQLKDALGTSVDMTIYRKLRQLSYLCSMAVSPLARFLSTVQAEGHGLPFSRRRLEIESY